MKVIHRPAALCRGFAVAVMFWLTVLLMVDLPASPLSTVAPPPLRSKPLIIAHRGGALESTENTIAAFQRAFRIGADGIETDIRLTRDGIVVVYHDDYFGRVEGLPQAQRTRLVSDMTYAALTAQTLIPVGEDTGGRRVPTLGDLLAQVHGPLLNIELKRCAKFDDLVKKTIAILKDYSELDRIVLEAPDLDTAKKLRKGLGSRLKLHINPEVDHTIPFRDSLKQLLKFKPHSVSISYKLLARDMVEDAHRAGVEVWVWTVNDNGVAERMRELGVDAIKTDRPTTLMDLFRGEK
jgi:glycerophosphoryl diester phosphodiesterase